MIKLDIVELKAGHIPVYKHETDACADCMASLEEDMEIKSGETRLVPLGFCVAIPEGWEGVIKGRSGLSSQGILGAIGTIDCGYTGEVKAIITNISKEPFVVQNGDRVCQFKVQVAEKINFNKVDTLAKSDRGSNGFGSTGR